MGIINILESGIQKNDETINRKENEKENMYILMFIVVPKVR